MTAVCQQGTNPGLHFITSDLDSGLFRLMDQLMTQELTMGGHHRPEGTLHENNLPNSKAIFACEQLSIVGMIVTSHEPQEAVCKFYRLWVIPSARKGGVGRALMEFAERYASKVGSSWIEFDTGLDLSSAVALYRKMGYQEAPLPSHGPNGLLFTKSLL